jgi:hypothetical protein
MCRMYTELHDPPRSPIRPTPVRPGRRRFGIFHLPGGAARAGSIPDPRAGSSTSTCYMLHAVNSQVLSAALVLI